MTDIRDHAPAVASLRHRHAAADIRAQAERAAAETAAGNLDAAQQAQAAVQQTGQGGSSGYYDGKPYAEFPQCWCCRKPIKVLVPKDRRKHERKEEYKQAPQAELKVMKWACKCQESQVCTLCNDCFICCKASGDCGQLVVI